MDLKAYLDAHRESHASFAVRAKVARQTVYNLLSGTSQPSLDLARTIEAVTDGMVPISSWPPRRDGKKKLRAAYGSKGGVRR